MVKPLVLVAALLFLLPALFLLPIDAAADLTRDHFQAAVYHMGCKATVTILDTTDPNAWYVPPRLWEFGDGNIVMTQGLLDMMTDREELYILLHESGHCLQFKEGFEGILSSKQREWEADALALRHGLFYGITAADVQSALEKVLGDVGATDLCSPSHGCIRARIHAAWLYYLWLVSTRLPFVT